MYKRSILGIISIILIVIVSVALVIIYRGGTAGVISNNAGSFNQKNRGEIQQPVDFTKTSAAQLQLVELATIDKEYPYNEYPNMTGKFTSLFGKIAFSLSEPKVAYSFKKGDVENVFLNGVKVYQADWICSLNFTADGKQLRVVSNNGEQFLQADVLQEESSSVSRIVAKHLDCPFQMKQINENDEKYIQTIGKGANAECLVNVNGKKGKRYPLLFATYDDVPALCPISNIIYDEQTNTVAYSVNQSLTGFVVVNEKEGKHYTAVDAPFFTPQKKVAYKATLKPLNPGLYIPNGQPLPNETVEYLVIDNKELSSFSSIYTESIRYSHNGACMLYGALQGQTLLQVSEALLPQAKENPECTWNKKVVTAVVSPNPFILHVITVYEGNAHQQGVVKVHVNDAAKPVILALTAYEPTIWKIEKGEGVHIEKIILGGYNYKEQQIKGVTDVNSEVVEGLDYYSSDHPSMISSQLEILTGIKPSSVQKAYTGKEFTIDAVR